MNSKTQERRGISIVYIVILMTVLCAFASLAVDLGRVQLVKTQLRAAADAAARAGAVGLETSVTQAQTDAVNAAHDNLVDGTACDLVTNQDIDFGTWDSSTNTFNVLTGSNRASATAVRVTAQRTQPRGNAVPLLFAKLIGRSTCDLHAVAIASRPDGGFGVVGLNYIKMGGNSSDSYWSTTGYVPGNFGAIGSNGSISLNGNSTVHGDARPGVGQQVYGAAGRVSGSTAPLTAPLVYANASAGSYSISNDNWRIPPNMLSGGATNFVMSNKDAITLPGGNYYFCDFSMNGNATLNLSASTTFYCYGNISVGGHISTAGSVPKNLLIVTVPQPNGQPPGTLSITTQSNLYANIYAPQSPITLGGAGDIYGSVVGKSVDMTGSSAIHYDLTKPGTAITLVQ